MWSDCPGQGEHGGELRAGERERKRRRRGESDEGAERERWSKKVGPD